jgi:hypothetical protein
MKGMNIHAWKDEGAKSAESAGDCAISIKTAFMHPNFR